MMNKTLLKIVNLMMTALMSRFDKLAAEDNCHITNRHYQWINKLINDNEWLTTGFDKLAAEDHCHNIDNCY